MDTATIGHNSEIAAYSEYRAQLGKLRELNSEAVFDYETPNGNKDARSHVYKLRKTKSAVEKSRKEEKASSLEYGRRVDEQAKGIMGEIDAMIDVHAKPLEAIEQRENERIATHEANLAEIVGAGQQTVEQWETMPLDAMKDRLTEIEVEPTGEKHRDEFALRIAHAKETAVTLMRGAIERRQKHDAEQAELLCLRKKEDERKRTEHEDCIRREATKMAEAKSAKEAEALAVQEKEAAERRELELKLTAERAERQKAEAEQRALTAASDAEDRLKREATARADQEAADLKRREADNKHRGAINRESVGAFVKHGIAEETAKQVVTLIAKHAIPNILVSY